MRCSPPHDFRHGGLRSHMQGACGLHQGVAGRAGGEKKFAFLVVSVMDNNNRRMKLWGTVVLGHLYIFGSSWPISTKNRRKQFI